MAARIHRGWTWERHIRRPRLRSAQPEVDPAAQVVLSVDPVPQTAISTQQTVVGTAALHESQKANTERSRNLLARRGNADASWEHAVAGHP